MGGRPRVVVGAGVAIACVRATRRAAECLAILTSKVTTTITIITTTTIGTTATVGLLPVTSEPGPVSALGAPCVGRHDKKHVFITQLVYNRSTRGHGFQARRKMSR